MPWYWPFTKQEKSSETKAIAVRRWDGAKTDRLNEAHWSSASGFTINQDLQADLPTLRIRCLHEAHNNAFVEGMIFTHSNDVVGPNGPKLNALSDMNPEYGKKLEKVFGDWWAMPDVNGVLSGADMLNLWNRSMWPNGEFLVQKTKAAKTAGKKEILFRLLNLDPRNLGNPTMSTSTSSTVLGIDHDKHGKPLTYWIKQVDLSKLYGEAAASLDYKDYPASQIIHGFRHMEPGQARGVPWIAPVLQVIADLRDYDVQVLDAARAAADYCIMIHTDNTEAEFVEYNESMETERRTASFLPPGYKADQMDPKQPATGYVDYRHEKLAEIGRPVSMPGMMVRLDAGDHNFSSARFDGQLYQRGISAQQAWFARTVLNDLVYEVQKEARMLGMIEPAPPDLRLDWTWVRVPHVDPQKEAKATELGMKNGYVSLTQSCMEEGRDVDDVIAERKRDDERLKAAGLPTVAETTAVQMTDDEPEEPEGTGQNARHNISIIKAE